jgi:hypothetical protein
VRAGAARPCESVAQATENFICRAAFVDVCRPNSRVGLCQNCVTYPLNRPVNTVIYEDMSTRIDLA